jgi:uncharacterized membrane protein YeaQ/YmgE (transglycosylase-associated protein family)
VGLIVWLVIALIAGAIARLLVPGRDPLGLIGTLALGVVGSLVGGLLGNLIGGRGFEIAPAGILGSIIGSGIVLLVYRRVAGRPGWRGRRVL